MDDDAFILTPNQKRVRRQAARQAAYARRELWAKAVDKDGNYRPWTDKERQDRLRARRQADRTSEVAMRYRQRREGLPSTDAPALTTPATSAAAPSLPILDTLAAELAQYKK